MSNQLPDSPQTHKENSMMLTTMRDFSRALSHHLPRRLQQARETGRALRSIGRTKGKR